MHRFFHRWVLSRPAVCFAVMGLSFLVFGLGSVNLVHVLAANLSLLTEHGWQALMDGALRQLMELLVSGYGSLVAYVVFKSCEHALVEVWTSPPPPPQPVKTVESDSSPSDPTNP